MSFRPLVDQLGQLLVALDLSFLVSGAVGAAGLSLAAHELGLAPDVDGYEVPALVVAVVGAYVVGLVCHPIGRGLREGFSGMTARGLVLARLDEYGVDWRTLLGTGDAEVDEARVYTMLWARLREDDAMRESYLFLQGYWVRTAVYDGLPPAAAALALGLWLRVWNLDLGAFWWVVALLGAGTVAVAAVAGLAQVCFRQARDLQDRTITEIAATAALAARDAR